jgi:O-acetyl-ADP-ribose deacetylase (regulator of RNase III)
MIIYTKGNIFDTEADALVNPVNCVGVMGKGLALQFKARYPLNFQLYAKACKKGEMKPGALLVVREDDGKNIFNFPTKRHWRDKSRLDDIRDGLKDLANWMETAQFIRSVAIPPLGCGLGGLNWLSVKQLIEQTLSAVQKPIYVYEP